MNISPLSKEQWGKVLTVVPFAFFSTFVSVFALAGGIQDSYEATVTLILSAAVAGVNAAAYALYQFIWVDGKR